MENLSAESLLKSVIDVHTAQILETIAGHLRRMPIFSRRALNLIQESQFGNLSKLGVQITPSRTVELLIEPITGRYALHRPSPSLMKGEHQINNTIDAPNKASDIISRIRLMTMQEEIEARAKSMGWDILKMLNLGQAGLKKWFGGIFPLYIMYLRKKSWTDNWVLAVSLGNAEDSWWIAEV